MKTKVKTVKLHPSLSHSQQALLQFNLHLFVQFVVSNYATMATLKLYNDVRYIKRKEQEGYNVYNHKWLE